jgi:hypothetical protein
MSTDAAQPAQGFAVGDRVRVTATGFYGVVRETWTSFDERWYAVDTGGSVPHHRAADLEPAPAGATGWTLTSSSGVGPVSVEWSDPAGLEDATATVTGALELGAPLVQFNYATAPAPVWPELPEAAYSEVGALARRWLRDSDWSAVGPLTDALRDAQREDDVRAVRCAVAQAAAEKVGYGGHIAGVSYYPSMTDVWQVVAMRCLWFDLFSWESTLAKLAEGDTP